MGIHSWTICTVYFAGGAAIGSAFKVGETDRAERIAKAQESPTSNRKNMRARHDNREITRKENNAKKEGALAELDLCQRLLE
jgi:hypothetical protein